MSKATGFETFKKVLTAIDQSNLVQQDTARKLVQNYANLNQDKPEAIDLLNQYLDHKF